MFLNSLVSQNKLVCLLSRKLEPKIKHKFGLLLNYIINLHEITFTCSSRTSAPLVKVNST